MLLDRKKLDLPASRSAANEPAGRVGPELGVLFPKHEITSPVWRGIRGVSQDSAFSKMTDSQRRSSFVLPARDDRTTLAGLDPVESQNGRYRFEADASEYRVRFVDDLHAETLRALA